MMEFENTRVGIDSPVEVDGGVNKFLLSDSYAFSSLVASGAGNIKDVLKARCNQIINDNPGHAKDIIVEIAKKQGYNIKHKHIKGIKCDAINGSEADWGIQFVELKVLSDETRYGRADCWTFDHANDSLEEQTEPVERDEKWVDETNWTFNAGVKVTGTAAFKGFVINFGVDSALLRSDEKMWHWFKEITYQRMTITTVTGYLDQDVEEARLQGVFKVTKGSARCSCVIQKCGKRTRSANINLMDLLTTDWAKTVISEGVFKDIRSIEPHIEELSRPYGLEI